MSRIDELIGELCPDGVRFTKLSEVTNLSAGDRVTKANMSPSGNYPVYGAGNVPTGRLNEWNHEDGLIFSRAGAGAGFVNFIEQRFWATDVCFVSRGIPEGPLIKFVYYWMKSNERELMKRTYGGSLPKIDKRYLWDHPVPVPPLSVQEEIVRILDTFTKLEAELEAELEARTIQYEVTRKRLMAFDALDENPLSELIRELCPSGVSTNRLGNIAEIGTGSSDRKEASETGQFPFFVRSKVVMAKDDFEFDEEAIVIPGEGGIGDIFHHVVGKYALHQRAYRIHFLTDDVVPRFAYFHFAANFKAHILSRAVDATVTSIRKPMIESFPIPIPPIRVQKEIVRILESFDSLVGDLSSGLPAEIAARRKQYEYYREKLLSFERSAA